MEIDSVPKIVSLIYTLLIIVVTLFTGLSTVVGWFLHTTKRSIRYEYTENDNRVRGEMKHANLEIYDYVKRVIDENTRESKQSDHNIHERVDGIERIITGNYNERLSLLELHRDYQERDVKQLTEKIDLLSSQLIEKFDFISGQLVRLKLESNGVRTSEREK